MSALTRRHWLAVVSYLLVVALTAALGLASSDILSAVRGYVAGESRWSKGQKEALYHLDRYARLQDPADYGRFEASLSVPLGDRVAREQLSSDQPDLEAARAGLLQGGNHPDDIDSMMKLFVRFKDVSFMADAIAIWAEADLAIDELRLLGQRIRELVEAGEADSPALRALAHQLPPLDARLTQLERQFSDRLGEASRLSKRLVVWTTLLLSILLACAGLVMIARLLSQQLASERALREGNERWALAADAAGIGVFDWDVERDRVALDARAAAMTDLPAVDTEADGDRLAGQALHPDDRGRVQVALRQAIDRAEPVAVRYRVEPVEGETRQIELRARVRAHGRYPRMIGILRDVSQDMQAERLRLDKEAAERANRAKGEFLSRVSHELRTPLNAVLGFAQLMQLDNAEALRPAQAQRVQHVIDSGRHLLDLINDMLDVTSIDSGGVKFSAQDVAVGPVLERCSDRLSALAEAQHVRIVPQHPFPELHVLADPRRLEQVFINLISNAIKYNRPDGEVRLTLAPDGDDVVAAVHDTGAGMTEEQLGQLFQPFNRLGAEYSKVVGSGLGLVITRQLVTLMGGSVAASSRAGVGSTFVVRLPRGRPVPA
jgi:signal transduction histidine kinase